MNGRTTNVAVDAKAPGAQVYVDGVPANPFGLVNVDDHIIVVRAPGMAHKLVRVRPRVPIAPIVLDVVFAVPSFLIVPITDAIFNARFKLDPEKGSVTLEPAKGATRDEPAQVPGEPLLKEDHAPAARQDAADYA